MTGFDILTTRHLPWSEYLFLLHAQINRPVLYYRSIRHHARVRKRARSALRWHRQWARLRQRVWLACAVRGGAIEMIAAGPDAFGKRQRRPAGWEIEYRLADEHAAGT